MKRLVMAGTAIWMVQVPQRISAALFKFVIVLYNKRMLFAHERTRKV